MAVSEDWAAFVRDRRRDRWKRRGGPGSLERQALANPVLAVGVGLALFFAVLLAISILVGPVSWIIWALGATGAVSQYQVLKGERIVYDEWSAETYGSPDPTSSWE